ncbi:MAG: two-component regulator propeller domain-containing protein, partial [Bacteroidia bacterium]|nr:two-component regulator propeller domain-containing protein [Bacteroidia bacterium]
WVSYERELYVSIQSRTDLVKVTMKEPLTASVYGMFEKDHQLVYATRSGEIGTVDISRVDIHSKEVFGEPIRTELEAGRNTPFVDSDGDIWVYNREVMGLWRYVPRSDKWTYYSNTPDSKFYIPPYMIRNIIQDKNGVLWVATDHAGVILIDKANKEVKYLKHEEKDDRSIVDDATSMVYMDYEGTVWLGYYHSGLSYYNSINFRFELDKLSCFKDIDPTFVANITTIEEDKQGGVWLGTNGSGLAYINEKRQECKLYTHDDNNPNSLPADVIVSLKVASDGKLWIGTFLGGLSIFDGKTFTNYMGRKDVPETIASQSIWSIEERHNGTMWVGSLNKGLCSYDPRNGAYTSYTIASHKIYSDYIACLEASKTSNSLYAGTEHGVMLISGTNTPTFRILDEEKQYSILHENIHDLLEDSRGLLWIGTQSGLCLYNPVTNEIKPIKLHTDATNDFVSALAEDEEHNIWVSTANGLSYLKISSRPTSNNNYQISQYKFTKDDGLEDGTYNQRSMERLSDGRIFVGRSFGLSVFSPKELRLNTASPQVHFTSLKIFGEETSPNKTIFDVKPLDKQLYLSSEEIEIPSKISLFSIEFSTLNYVLPAKTSYTCRLEGWSDEVYNTQRPEVTFSNLLPGKYTLYVSATNSDGYTNNHEYGLPIRILPPWYATPLAFAVYSLLFVLLAWGVIQLCVFYLQTRNVLDVSVEREVGDNTQMRQQEAFIKSVSQDIVSQLNRVFEPMNALKEEVDSESKAGEHVVELEGRLKQVHSTISQIVNLDFIDNKDKLVPVRRDIVAHVRQILDSYERHNEHSVSFTFYASQPTIGLDFDEEKMTVAISNILSNAVKYTPDLGQISLSIEAHPETVTISISDTGIGIPDKYKEHIFDRFYQIPSRKTVGYGIGLHVANEIIKMHNGTIEVKDNVDGGGGVWIEITLPYLQRGSKTLVKQDIEEIERSADVADTVLVSQARKLIIEHIQTQYGAEDLARSLNLSRIHLYRKVMAVTGLAPVDFIRKVRLQHSAELLKDTKLSIASVAKEFGFSNMDYFRQYFKEEFGKEVEEYRRELTGESSDFDTSL